MYFIKNLKQQCLENKKYHFDCVSLDFLRLFHNTWYYYIILVMYVTFTKAKKDRDLSYKETF